MMPSRLAIQKLRRHLHGLENYPMSSSYPQESGETEFREMVAAVHKSESERKVETNVTVREETKSYCKPVIDAFSNCLCGTKDQEDQEDEDVDETDGRTEDILKPLVKLYFLKILLIDIGISLGDVVTDLAQGINLIFDHNWNIQWSTFHYGLIVLVFVWLPLVPLALHVVTFRKAAQYYQTEKKLINILVIAASIIFFPLVPTFSKLDLRRSTIVRTCVPLFISPSKHFGGALMLELLLLADVIGSLRGRRLRRENLCACIREIILPCRCFINFFQLLYERQTERGASQA